jgi:hypothetical protein
MRRKMTEAINFEKLDELFVKSAMRHSYEPVSAPLVSIEEMAGCIPESSRDKFKKVADKLACNSPDEANYILQICRLYDNPLAALEAFDGHTPMRNNRTFTYDIESMYQAELKRCRSRKMKGINNRAIYLEGVLDAILEEEHSKIRSPSGGSWSITPRQDNPGNSWDNAVRILEG